MWFFRRKTSPRRDQVRKNIAADRFAQIRRFANTETVASVLLWLVFVVLCVLILSVEIILKPEDISTRHLGFRHVAPITVITLLISFAGVFYIYRYQNRIVKNLARSLALGGLFVLLLAATKLGMLLTHDIWWATGTAVTTAIILTIAYNQRFAIGMSLLYCILVCFAAGSWVDFRLFLTTAAGAVTCCYSLREIRTRIKLLKVSTLAAVIVFVMSTALGFLPRTAMVPDIFRNAGLHAGVTLAVGMLIQSLLPLIEKIFRITTSMTLLDYSDANQPLLRRLAMEAPGTFSHSLLIGSIAEAAAESIGRNGLLCRVGAYYHDIGKINKPGYFVENEIGSASRHKELSPAMSQLIIVGHVKDGTEMAKEYGLPVVLRQFIETHHGTTVIEYFYSEAKKRHDEKQAGETTNSKKAARTSPPPSESEFRYPGPKPRTKEAAIVMLADTTEGAVRSLSEVTHTRIQAVVHNMAMKRLQDGQFDECDLSLRELSRIETSISKTLAAHHHGRIAYPTPPDVPEDSASQKNDRAETPVLTRPNGRQAQQARQ
jgi:putative nucleotidyltransferase with HDIG domain